MHYSSLEIGVHRRAAKAQWRPRAGVRLQLKVGLAAFLSGAGLFILILTLTPFKGGADVAANADGNIVNQIGYIVLSVSYLFAMISLMDRRLLPLAFPTSWLLVFVIASWSCLQAYDSMAAARGVILTFLSMTLVGGILLLPRSERDFVNAGANASLVLILINYAAVVLIPNVAIHTAAGGEPWHAGSWRGHMLHKNFAAPVFSVLAMFGIYCWRAGVKWRGAIIFAMAAFFVLQTQSKTTTGFFPLAIAIVFVSRLTGRPQLTIFVHCLLVIIIGCLTIGSVMSPALHALTASLIADPTFTGRDSIWAFGLKSMTERLWDGYGYYGFWLSPGVSGREANYEAAWDVRGIVSGHNTYLDTLLMLGLPSGMIVLSLLFFKPLLDYLKAYRRVVNRPLADFFLMIVVFMTYVGMLETFLLNRADAMWLVFVLGSYGMTIIARKTVR